MKKIALLYSPLSLSILIFLYFQLQISNLFAGLLDEGFVLYNAQLISQGQIPYRDFFMTTTPGSYYLIALLFKFFGNYMIIGRILGVASGILTLVACNLLFKLKKYWQYVYLISMAFLLVSPAKFFSYNDAFLLLLVALYFLIKGSERNKFLLVGVSGLVSGLGFVFKQSVGGLIFPAFILGIILVTGRNNIIKAIFSYLIGWLAVLVPVIAYFYFNHALPQVFYFIFLFASAVKSHQSSFLIHRLAAMPIIVLFFILLRNAKLRVKLLFFSIASLLFLFYLLLDIQRIGRLLTYLPDTTFYVQTLAFIFPLIILAYYLTKRTDHGKKITLVAISYLVIFLSHAASGYNIGSGVVVAPLLIPLIIYFLEKYGNIFYNKRTTFLLTTLILIYTIAFSYNFMRLQNPAFAGYLESQYTANVNIEEAKYIRFPQTTASDLDQTISYIKANTKKDEKIFCFPYCPGLLFFSERNGGSFYNLFYFETFAVGDQNSVIQDLQKNKVRFVILEKSEDDISLKARIQSEDKRLPKIKDYIVKNYGEAFSTSGFTILKKIESR